MKKFNKYISLAAVAVMGSGWLASCDDSKNNDVVQEYTGAPGVYFSNTENAYLELSEDANTIIYPVYRDEAGPELTVAVQVTPVANYTPKDIYTFPESVTFPAGSKVADFVIGYDISKAEMGVEQEYELMLDAEANPFASNNVVITLVNPAPWNLLGTGDYYDYFIGISPESTGPAKVEIYQQGIDPNIFRVSNPYVGYNDIENSYFEFRVLQQGEVFQGATVTQPDLVGYTLYYAFYYSDDQDDIYIAFPGLFTDDLSYWSGNKVLEYQEDGLPGLVQLAPAYYLYNQQAAYNYPDFSPYIIINFPDYVSLDTDLSLTYEGILTPASQVQEVLLSATLGDDLTEAKVAVGTGSAAQIEAGIENGSIQAVSVSESGYVKVPFGNDMQSGYYYAVAVGYVDNEVKNTASTRFFYLATSADDTDQNDGWNSLGYVDYTDGFVCASVFLSNVPESLTYSVELQQSQENPGLYRLVNPYGEPFPFNEPGDYNPYIDSYIYFNMEDPNKVYLLQSPQTLDWNVNATTPDEELGALEYVWSMANYAMENDRTDEQIESYGYYGTYADGKVTFSAPVISGNQLSSTLISYWSYPSNPEYDGMVYANCVLDWDRFEATNYTDPYLYVTGTRNLYNPFCIDMSSLTTDDAYRLDGHVMLTKKALTPYKPSFNNLKKIGRPTLREVKGDGKALGKSTSVKLERRSF